MKRIRGTFAVAVFLIAPGISHSDPKPSSYSKQVTIRRDTYGVPHILGKTEEAAAFGLGYAQAEDHAVEIARRLVSARAEAAKYFGSNADTDFLLKQFDNYEVCRAHFRALDPLMQRIYQAYIAGVNLHVEQNRGSLPDWIPVFNEIDVMAYIRQSAVTSVRGVIRNLRRKYEQQVSSSPDDDEGFGDTWFKCLRAWAITDDLGKDDSAR